MWLTLSVTQTRQIRQNWKKLFFRFQVQLSSILTSFLNQFTNAFSQLIFESLLNRSILIAILKIKKDQFFRSQFNQWSINWKKNRDHYDTTLGESACITSPSCVSTFVRLKRPVHTNVSCMRRAICMQARNLHFAKVSSFRQDCEHTLHCCCNCTRWTKFSWASHKHKGFVIRSLGVFYV